jgi:hypothetical protein
MCPGPPGGKVRGPPGWVMAQCGLGRAGRELAGRGAAWTEERGTSDEGRRRIKAPRQLAGQQSTSDEGRRRIKAPR